MGKPEDKFSTLCLEGEMDGRINTSLDQSAGGDSTALVELRKALYPVAQVSEDNNDSP